METKIRIATGKPADEFRNMEVGDVVLFPADKYNATTIRSVKGSCLFNERLDGMDWKTSQDFENKAIRVTRTA